MYVWKKAREGWYVLHKPLSKFEVMIWGCISWFGPGTVASVDGKINANKYKDLFVAQHFPERGYIFQDDNAPVHRARLIVEYKTHNYIPLLAWLAQSPDTNIIEYLCLLIERKLQSRKQNINS